MHPEESPATAHFDPILYRPNVAAILQRADAGILVAERVSFKGAWQFPQGGVDDGESVEEALFRELQEEIGVTRDLVSPVMVRSGYRYAFPKGRLKYGIYGGQEQTYYLCSFHGTDADIHLDTHHREFSRWKWIQPRDFDIRWVPRFKQRVYRAIFKDFFGLDL